MIRLSHNQVSRTGLIGVVSGCQNIGRQIIDRIFFIKGKINMKKLLVVLFIAFCSFSVMAKPVNINTADAKTIGESLKGIGLKKAEAIVKYRTEKGPFKTVDELDNVSGIGKKTVESIKNDVLLSDEATAEPKVEAAPSVAPVPAATPVPSEPKADKK